MPEALETVQQFLGQWKPFAELPPGNSARRGIVRLIATDDPEERKTIFHRVSILYQLHQLYEELAIRRMGKNDKSPVFSRLFQLPVEDMARAFIAKEPREVLVLLQECFEFGRFSQEPRIQAVRMFLLDFWAMEEGLITMKYSIYPNGILFSVVGATHDEMASRFNKLGLGSGRPSGGGQIQRNNKMEFLFDTASTAFGGIMKPEFVIESLKKWVRLTGGDEQKLRLTYQKRLGV